MKGNYENIKYSFLCSVMLGHLRLFPSDTVSGWASGTGMAGLFGSAFYMGLAALGLSNMYNEC